MTCGIFRGAVKWILFRTKRFMLGVIYILNSSTSSFPLLIYSQLLCWQIKHINHFFGFHSFKKGPDRNMILLIEAPHCKTLRRF